MEQEKLIEKIVREIVQQSLHEHWANYAAMLVLLFLGTAAAGYFGSYFQARGQRAATDADLKKILDQVEQTTRLTKDIELRLGLADWTVKERITLRRDRLERVVRAASALEEWLSSLSGSRVFGDEQAIVGVSPMAEFEALTLLYFPDLNAHLIATTAAFDAIVTRIYNARLQILPRISEMKIAELSSDVEGHKRAGDERIAIAQSAGKDIVELRSTLHRELVALREESAKIMHGMMEIDHPTRN
jgi:hypothetical protein